MPSGDAPSAPAVDRIPRRYVGTHMAFGLTPARVVVTVHDEKAPTEDDWEHYVTFARTLLREPTNGVLVHSLGGGPNPKQRKELIALFPDEPSRVALVSSSLLMRSVGVAIGWFNRELKVFSPDELGKAFDYLGLSGRRRDTVRTELKGLQRELGLPEAPSARGA